MNTLVMDRALWLVGDLLQVSLLIVLISRSRIKKFPLFGAFLVSNLVEDVALFLVFNHGSRSTYFNVYWGLKILEVVAQLCVFYEVARIVFRPMGVWAADVRSRFVSFAGASVLGAVLLTWLATPPTESAKQVIVIKGSFFAACLMSELFVITTSLSNRVGLAWRNHITAIAQGVGIYALATVVIEGANSFLGVKTGSSTYDSLERTRVVIYLGCVTYWLVSLYRDEPARREITPEMRAKLFTLQGQLAYDLGQIRSRDK